MHDMTKHRQELLENGFSLVEDIYSPEEVQCILNVIDQTDTSKGTFRKTIDLFAIRQFLKEIPETFDLIFNRRLRMLINAIVSEDFFVVKSIYFDKPETSNWYVAYHQDLTISVDRKMELEQYGPWTVKQDQFAVQPPIDILENITTIRIHLDDTDEYNGALTVIPESHARGIYRPEHIDWNNEKETVCCVKKGGLMLMKPLTLHRSARTSNGKRRRVIHIELSNKALPDGLSWSERMDL